MTEVVYVVSRRSGGNGDHYHTDEDCRKLRAATNVHEYKRENIEHMRELCSVCADDVTTPSGSQQTAPYRALRDADPSEVTD